ncbi:hypothetical protein PM082_000441 [Marasmius tenuissimus]|nr:hypothetical protein PM082_000441 [Marasmius tenuissimus]
MVVVLNPRGITGTWYRYTPPSHSLCTSIDSSLDEYILSESVNQGYDFRGVLHICPIITEQLSINSATRNYSTKSER